ncbi:FecR domain-containing protein [Microbacteriaceae bacterium K1510]|nr:FecR domain-containing protein [Microbacteriaceae bacterium K1510]
MLAAGLQCKPQFPDHRCALVQAERTTRFADDVAIDLNTQTSLVIRPATATEDCIELIGGEASFAAQRLTRALAVVTARGRVMSETGRFDVRYIATGANAPVSVTANIEVNWVER